MLRSDVENDKESFYFLLVDRLEYLCERYVSKIPRIVKMTEYHRVITGLSEKYRLRLIRQFIF